MALNPKLSNLAANAAADAVVDLADSGLLRIYDGTQPADADTAVTTQVLLAELTLNSTAFGAAVAGVATANAITQDASANNSGTATWFRVLRSNGTTVLFDGSAGTGTVNLVLSSASIVAGSPVQITSFTYTQEKT